MKAMNLQKLLPCLAAVVVALCAAGVVKADAIFNGDFGTGDFTGWNCGGVGGGFAVVTSPAPPEGTYCASVWGTPTGGWAELFQPFNAKPGDILTFYFQGNANPEESAFTVFLSFPGGGTIDLFNGQGEQDVTTQWQFETYDSFFRTGQYWVAFIVSGTANIYVSDVQITPEPTTLGLLSAGMAAFVLRRKLSRRI
jgi:hypothetical protein